MSISSVNPRHIRYQELKNNIHHFTFNKPTREAVDEFITIQNEISQQTGYFNRVLTLMDITESGLPSLKHIITQIRATVKRNRYYGTSRMSRTAVVYSDPGLGSLLNSGIQMLEQINPGNPVQAFMDYDQAVVWLLES